MKGYLHSFESMAALDGLGLRFAVFLAGCPLRCAYCHNPDTWFLGEKTIKPEELVKKILRFRPYFGDRGGVTFSGGEPLLQASFLSQVIPLLKKESISYSIDTSGGVDLTDDVKQVLSNAQQVLLDLKFWDDDSYRVYTGMGIVRTKKTLAYLNEIGKDTVIRTVVVPGVNDTEEKLSRYLEHLRGMNCVTDYELLPFHTMGFFKYDELKIPNPFADKAALSVEVKEKLQGFVRGKLRKEISLQNKNDRE